MSFHLMPWPLTLNKGQRSNGLFLIYLEKLRKTETICIADIKEIIYGLSFGVMTFDLDPRSKFKWTFSSNISKTTRERGSICIVDTWEIIYGLSFAAMTFDLDQRSKVKCTFSHISRQLRKTETSFVLQTYRKSYMDFHFVSWPLTLNEGQNQGQRSN